MYTLHIIGTQLSKYFQAKGCRYIIWGYFEDNACNNRHTRCWGTLYIGWFMIYYSIVFKCTLTITSILVCAIHKINFLFYVTKIYKKKILLNI